MLDTRTAVATRILLGMAAAITLYMALQPHPPALPIDAFGDKFEHSLAFVTLGLLASLAFPTMGLVRIGERLSFFGALVEVCQAMPAVHRDCDIWDWVTDTVALTLVLLIVHGFRQLGPHRLAARLIIRRD